MPPKLVVRFRVVCVVLAFVLAFVPAGLAAETKASPLVGATREQVIQALGEPKNTIVAGNREVLLFERDRVTLRDNVVIQVERLPEPPRRPAAEPAPAPDATTTAAAPAQPSTSTTTPRGTAPAGAAPETPPPAPTAAAVAPSAPGTVKPAATTRDAPLEIKIRAPGSTPRPAPKAEPAPVTVSRPSTVTAVTPPPVATLPPAPVPKPDTAKNIVSTTPSVTEPARTETPPPPTAEHKEKAPAAEPAAAVPPPPEESGLSTRTYVIIGVVVAIIAILIWRSRQRQLELAASALSHAPFTAPVATSGGAVFTPELLAKLDWKRFEELVAAYYSKTGVVAVRTKTGPASPVHIKISWKGEPRPFALVQCIAQPAGLVDAKPLQDLMTALAAEDIRRGYVVTTGKFSIPARDFAEEKHLTLLPSDILLEKINALPDSARNELMQETTAGDYTTPSCPKCEAKMVVAPDNPNQWRCPNHPDQVVPKKPAA